MMTSIQRIKSFTRSAMVMTLAMVIVTHVGAQVPKQLVSAPAKVDVFPTEQFKLRLGVPENAPASYIDTLPLPFPVDLNYPAFYMIPAANRAKVMDQGSCGSCVAYATSVALSSILTPQLGLFQKIGLSSSTGVGLYPDPMTLFNAGGRNCTSGGWFINDATELLTNREIMMAADINLAGAQAPVRTPLATIKVRAGKRGVIGNQTVLPRGVSRIDAMRKFISTRGALVSRMQVFPSFNRYAGGVYNNKKFNDKMIADFDAATKAKYPAAIQTAMETALKGASAAAQKNLATSSGGHAVAVVGYFKGGKLNIRTLLSALSPTANAALLPNLELDLEPFWIVQNSWGSKWGINGYFLMETNQPEIGFENAMYFVTEPMVTKNGAPIR